MGFKNERQRKAMFAKLNSVRKLSLLALKKRGINLKPYDDTDGDRWQNRNDPQPLNNRMPKVRFPIQNIGELDKEFRLPKDSIDFQPNEHSKLSLDPANVAGKVSKDDFLSDEKIGTGFKELYSKTSPVTHFKKALIDYEKDSLGYRSKSEHKYILSTDDGKTSIYSAEYLKYLLKEVKGKDAKFKMGASDSPLFIDAGETIYILAPRVENN